MIDIQEVKTLAVENYDKIFKSLGLDLDSCKIDQNTIRCCCPIHKGDNNTAFVYNTETGNWKCYTSDCSEKYGKDTIDLVRAIKKISFREAIKFIADTCNADIENIKCSYVKKDDTTSTYIQKDIETFKTKIKPISLDTFCKLANKDEEYFVNKFSTKAIDKFKISVCKEKGKPMYNRAFVPIMDRSGSYVIGLSGRTMYEMCEKCGKYHKKNILCPHEGNYKASSKWIHFGAETSTLYYNYSNAVKETKRTSILIITEGPKEVWWLYDCGIENAVAILGSVVTDAHLLLAIESGATTIVTCFDKDGAGIKAFNKLLSKFNQYFNIINVTDLLKDGQDLDDLDKETIKSIFLPILNKG